VQGDDEMLYPLPPRKNGFKKIKDVMENINVHLDPQVVRNTTEDIITWGRQLLQRKGKIHYFFCYTSDRGNGGSTTDADYDLASRDY
jgi:hypothetical protein